MKIKIGTILPGLVLLTLAGCGGGSSGSPVGPIPTAAQLAVTASPTSIAQGATTIYTFTMTNTSSTAVSGVGVSIEFGNGVTITQHPQFVCSASSFSYSSNGSASITYSSIPANGKCQLNVVVASADTGIISPSVLTIGNAEITGDIPIVTVNQTN